MKVVLHFREVFWPPAAGWISFVGGKDQFGDIKSLFKKTGTTQPSFPWVIWIGEPILVFYLSPGISIKRQEEGWTDQLTFNKCLSILSLRFGQKPNELFLSGFATGSFLKPQPPDYPLVRNPFSNFWFRLLRVVEWQKDPFSYGSYSYLALGSKGCHYEWLSEPEMNDRLLFAGEATERNSPATVEGLLIWSRFDLFLGAFVSGRREAHRIHSFLQSKCWFIQQRPY